MVQSWQSTVQSPGFTNTCPSLEATPFTSVRCVQRVWPLGVLFTDYPSKSKLILETIEFKVKPNVPVDMVEWHHKYSRSASTVAGRGQLNEELWDTYVTKMMSFPFSDIDRSKVSCQDVDQKSHQRYKLHP